jgi:hypothetical protein
LTIPLLHFGDCDQVCLDLRGVGPQAPLVPLSDESMWIEGWDWRPVAADFREMLEARERAWYLDGWFWSEPHEAILAVARKGLI